MHLNKAIDFFNSRLVTEYGTISELPRNTLKLVYNIISPQGMVISNFAMKSLTSFSVIALRQTQEDDISSPCIIKLYHLGNYKLQDVLLIRGPRESFFFCLELTVIGQRVVCYVW